MLIDALLEFSRGQKFTGTANSANANADADDSTGTDDSTNTVDSTNIVDLSQAAPSSGLDAGRLWVVVKVAEAVTGSLQITLQSADEPTGTFEDALVGPTIDAPAEGSQIVLPMPADIKRYAKLKYSGSLTAGKVYASITWGFDANQPFKQAESLKNVYP